jgi:MFS transporter, MHS family, proline/betaine transporter
MMPDAADTANARIDRKVAVAMLASCLGWSFDLFDLFILLYVAPVLGHAFFPAERPTLSLAAVYAAFAVTLFMRPVGSAVFGNFADLSGRKQAMTVAVIGVGIVTAAFGLLPTVQQVGLIAPALFLVLRLAQGVFVGGVVASTHTIGTESVPQRWRGLMSGMIGGGGGGLGALLASTVFLIASALFPGDSFAVWGWRFMFFCGIASSLLGLVVFRALEESPFWRQMDAARQGRARPRSPLRTLFGGAYRRVLLLNLLITFGAGGGYYISSGFLPTFLKVVNKLPNTTTSGILMATSCTGILGSLLVGALSEWTGRRRMFRLMTIVNIIALPLLFAAMAHAGGVPAATRYALAIAFLGNAAYAPVLIFLNERFPTALRASGTGLSWNIGFAIGGTMPTFVSLASRTTAHIPMVLGWFAVGIYGLFLIGSLLVPETRGRFT